MGETACTQAPPGWRARRARGNCVRAPMSSASAALAAARSTLLDGDGPLIKLHSVSQKWCCLLCKRQFAEEVKLGQHLLASEMHRSNVQAAQASGRLPAPSMPTAPPPPVVSSVHDAQPTRKRSLEDDSRLNSSQRLKQMEEFEQALAAKVRASSGAATMGGQGGPSAYRDRAKERREQVGGYQGLHADGGIRNARDINGNLDWKCGHCAKLNFAREVVCINCAREVRPLLSTSTCEPSQRSMCANPDGRVRRSTKSRSTWTRAISSDSDMQA